MAALAGRLASSRLQSVDVSCIIYRLLLCRHVHISAQVFGLSKAQNRQKFERKSSKMMERKVVGKLAKKKFYFNPTVFPSQPTSLKKRALSLGLKKRLNQVGSLIHENVSFLINSGALGQDLVNYGLEISKVEIPPDFNSINLFWFGSGDDERDDKLSNLLDEQAYKLRHELTQLRIIANTPRIHFVKDLSLARYTEVEQLLKIADMGDYAEDNVNSDDDSDHLDSDSVEVADKIVPDLSDLHLRSDLYDVDYDALTQQVNLRKHKKTDRFFDMDDISEQLETEGLSTFLEKRKHGSARSKRSIDRTEEFASMESLTNLSSGPGPRYGENQDDELSGYEDEDENEELSSNSYSPQDTSKN